MNSPNHPAHGKFPLGSAALTFDLEWAPDWCVRECFDLCRQAGVKATFFATNPLPVLADMAAAPRFELGLHPNFLPGSTQRADLSRPLTYAAVLEYLTEFLPQASSFRTHALYGDSSLYVEIGEHWPSLANDVSFFTYFQPLFEPLYTWPSTAKRPLVRLPFQFEDDAACLSRNFDYEAFLAHIRKEENLRPVIFNFHPLHVALNSRTIANYRALKNEVAIPAITPDEVLRRREPGLGTRTFLERLLTAAAEFHTISELGDKFRLAQPWPLEGGPVI
jgi:hypothetical protein